MRYLTLGIVAVALLFLTGCDQIFENTIPNTVLLNHIGPYPALANFSGSIYSDEYSTVVQCTPKSFCYSVGNTSPVFTGTFNADFNLNPNSFTCTIDGNPAQFSHAVNNSVDLTKLYFEVHTGPLSDRWHDVVLRVVASNSTDTVIQRYAICTDARHVAFPTDLQYSFGNGSLSIHAVVGVPDSGIYYYGATLMHGSSPVSIYGGVPADGNMSYFISGVAEPGPYTLSLWNYTHTSVYTSATYNFVVPAPPVLQQVSPPNNSWVKTLTPAVYADYSVQYGAVTDGSIKLGPNSIATDHTSTRVSAHSLTLPSDGTHALSVSADVTLSHMTATSPLYGWTIKVDVSPPAVAPLNMNIVPFAGANHYVVTSGNDAIFDVRDPLDSHNNPGSGIQDYEVYNDGVRVTNATFVGTNLSIPLPGEGIYPIRIKVRDNAGNEYDDTLKVVIDNTPPQLVFTSPANNAYLDPDSPIISGIVLPGSFAIQTELSVGFNQSPANIMPTVEQSFNGNNFTISNGEGWTGGQYTIVVQVPDVFGKLSAPVSLDFKVAEFFPASLDSGIIDYPYGPVKFAVSAMGPVFSLQCTGSLPPGLNFDPQTGVLSGTPNTIGRFNPTIVATDGIVTLTKHYTLQIESDPTLVPGSLPHAVVGSSYQTNPPVTIKLLYGAPPYSCECKFLTPDLGLTHSDSADNALSGTVVLGGTPSAAGVVELYVKFTDSQDKSIENIFEIEVVEDPSQLDEGLYFLNPSRLARGFVQVGLWDNAFDSNGDLINGMDGSNEQGNFISRDSRRFYLFVNDPNASSSTITVNWFTTKVELEHDPVGGPIDDKPANCSVTLTEIGPGSRRFMSKALMLVTDMTDRDEPTHTGITNTLAFPGEENHRTRLISYDDRPIVVNNMVVGTVDSIINGNVRAEYFRNPQDIDPTYVASATVFDRSPNDERRTIDVQFFRFGDPSTPEDYTSTETIYEQRDVLRQRFAVAGVRVRVHFDPDHDNPCSTDGIRVQTHEDKHPAPDILYVTPSKKEATIIANLRSLYQAVTFNNVSYECAEKFGIEDRTVIVAFIARFENKDPTLGPSGVLGEAFPDRYIDPGPLGFHKAKNVAFVAGRPDPFVTTHLPRQVTAHEVGHITINNLHGLQNPNLMMGQGWNTTDTVKMSKRLWTAAAYPTIYQPHLSIVDQIETIRTTIFYPPPSPNPLPNPIPMFRFAVPYDAIFVDNRVPPP